MKTLSNYSILQLLIDFNVIQIFLTIDVNITHFVNVSHVCLYFKTVGYVELNRIVYSSSLSAISCTINVPRMSWPFIDMKNKQKDKKIVMEIAHQSCTMDSMRDLPFLTRKG